MRKPPLYFQETSYSCAPACLRMVLASMNIEKSEAELRELCDCTVLGTSAVALVQAARQLGFTDTRKFNLNLDLLAEQLGRGTRVIAFIRAHLQDNTPPQVHSVVVWEIGDGSVALLDPWRGELLVPERDFEAEWEGMRRLTILIR